MIPFLPELPATPALPLPASGLPDTGAGMGMGMGMGMGRGRGAGAASGGGLDFAALLGAAALPPPPALQHGTQAEDRPLPGAASLPFLTMPEEAAPVCSRGPAQEVPAPPAPAADRLPDGRFLPDGGEILPHAAPQAAALRPPASAPAAGAPPAPVPVPVTQAAPRAPAAMRDPRPASAAPAGTTAAPDVILTGAPRRAEPDEAAEPREASAPLPFAAETVPAAPSPPPVPAGVTPAVAPEPPAALPAPVEAPLPPAIILAAPVTVPAAAPLALARAGALAVPVTGADAPAPARVALARGAAPRAAAADPAAPAVPALSVPSALPVAEPALPEPGPDALPAPAPAPSNTPVASAVPAAPAPLPPQTSPAPQPAAEPRLSGPSAPVETAIAQAGTLREALRAQRPEMVVRHAEFGMIALRLEPAAPDQWRAVLASRDPGFVPAIQAALAERALAPLPAATDGGTGMGQNGTGDQRYGASPNGGQGSSQPYPGQSGGRDGEAAPDHRRPSTAAALAARAGEPEEDPAGASRAPGGLFA